MKIEGSGWEMNFRKMANQGRWRKLKQMRVDESRREDEGRREDDCRQR